MDSAKNVGRKRLGRLPIVGGNSSSNLDVKRSCQIETRSHHGTLQKSKSKSPEGCSIDLSFSASFACDLEGDLDLMSALDKLENDYKPAGSGKSQSASVERNETSTEKRISSSKNQSRSKQREPLVNKTPKQVNTCDKKSPRDSGHKENKPGRTRNQRKRSLSKSSAFLQEDGQWASPINMSTPQNPQLANKKNNLLNSSRRNSRSGSTSQKSSKPTKGISKPVPKLQKTPDTTRTTRSSSKRTNQLKQKQGLDCTDTPVRGNVNDRNNRSDFFKSLFVDNTSFTDLSVLEVDPGNQETVVNKQDKVNSIVEKDSASNGHKVPPNCTKLKNGEQKSIQVVSKSLPLVGNSTDTEAKLLQSRGNVSSNGAKTPAIDRDIEKEKSNDVASNAYMSSDMETEMSLQCDGSIKIQPGVAADQLALSSWGLPESVLKQYHQRGITHMFQWQAECLLQGNVLGGGNLVYSAPTSAGKTMVAELLVLKRVLETRKKAIIILPFVSVTREKMFYLQELYQDAGIRVSGFMGSYAPAGGFSNVDVAVCTIEKGNGIINRCLEDNKLDQLGIIVVDELHLLGDPHRGYLLELLLTKISYMMKKSQKTEQQDMAPLSIQIVGMSATLPNLDLLAQWIDADLYRTDYRPVPLTECVKIGTALYDNNMALIRDIDTTYTVKGDTDHVVPLCIETVRGGHSILIFCPTKNWCEKLAETVAKEFYNLLKNPAVAVVSNEGFTKASDLLVIPLVQSALRDVVEQLKRTPVGVDAVLGRTVHLGVAYHHAGLTFDERDIIEGAFRQGILKVLIATSTLSSGVNLPARRVLIRTPTFHGQLIDFLTYKQMIGRAGRKGVDTAGESILLCKPSERAKAVKLVGGALPPVQSTLIRNEGEELSSSMKRAILEVVVSGVAMAPGDVAAYASCTLLAASLPADSGQTEQLIQQCIKFLQENEFVCSQTVTDNKGLQTERFVPTQLGAAVLASSLSPDEGLLVFSELQRARKCFVLENELHIIYQVTPIYAMGIGDSIDWYQYFCVWEALSPGMKKVAELAGVKESFLARAVQGRIPRKTEAQLQLLRIHRRFYTALVLHDLVQEVPLPVVAQKYNCNKGQLQSLQQSAATFAGMVTVFCARLGWSSLELILSQFQNRLTFGVQRELCDLVRISSLNGQRARVMFNGGYQTVAALAGAQPPDIEALLKNSAPFQSMKRQDKESDWDVQERCKARCIFLTGRKGMTEFEAAVAIIEEAKSIIQDELGGLGIQWKTGENRPNSSGPKPMSPVLTSPIAVGPQRNKSLLGKRRSKASGSPGSTIVPKPCVPCVISPPSSEKQSKTCDNEAASVTNPTQVLQTSPKPPCNTISLSKPTEALDVESQHLKTTRTNMQKPTDRVQTSAKDSETLTNIGSTKLTENRSQGRLQPKVMPTVEQNQTNQAQLNIDDISSKTNEMYSEKAACTENGNKSGVGSDALVGGSKGVTESAGIGQEPSKPDIALTKTSNLTGKRLQNISRMEISKKGCEQSFLEKMMALKQSTSVGDKVTLKPDEQHEKKTNHNLTVSTASNTCQYGHRGDTTIEMSTSLTDSNILNLDCNGLNGSSNSNKDSKQSNIKFSAEPLGLVHSTNIDDNNRQRPNCFGSAVVGNNRVDVEDAVCLNGQRTSLSKAGPKIMEGSVESLHLETVVKSSKQGSCRSSVKDSEIMSGKLSNVKISPQNKEDNSSANKLPRTSQPWSCDGKQVTVDDEFADSFVIDTQTATEFTKIPLKNASHLQMAIKGAPTTCNTDTAHTNTNTISNTDLAHELFVSNESCGNSQDLNNKSASSYDHSHKHCLAACSQNANGMATGTTTANTELNIEELGTDVEHISVPDHLSELSSNSAYNELDMNIADRSGVDMFDKSEELIAASHYEHLGLSGETRSQVLANESYQDLHIPYQSGQERCYEGVDENYPVIDNVRPAVVNYNGMNHIATDKNHNANGALGQFSSQKPKNGSNYSKLHEDLAIALEMGESFTNTFSEAGTAEKITSKTVNDKHETVDTSKAVDDNIGDSLTFSMMEQVLDSSQNNKAKAKDGRDMYSKQNCDICHLSSSNNAERMECDHVKPGNSVGKKSDEFVSRSKGSVLMDQCDSISTSVLNSLNDDTFVSPVKGANKRLRETPVSRKQKMQKTGNVSKCEKAFVEVVDLNNKKRNKQCVSSEKAGNSKQKCKKQHSADMTGVSPTALNTSTGSDCVPPTPPGEGSLLRSPQGQPRSTSKQTPRFSLRQSMAFSPRLTAGKHNTIEAGTGNTDDSGAQALNSNSRKKQPSNRSLAYLNGEIETRSSHASSTSGNRKADDDMKTDTFANLIDCEMDEYINEIEQLDEDGDDDKLCPSFIDPDESGLPLSQASFTIIDVCADKRLFKTFILEWRTKTQYALSLACERKQMQSVAGGIGGNFQKESSPSKQAAVVGGIPLDSEGLVIVGLAVSWDSRDAYYVSFTHDVPHGDPDDSLTPPPSDQDISISIRLKAIKSVLQQGQCKGNSITMVIFDVKSHYRTFAESCGFVPKGQFEDPKIACWMLDPGSREKNLHRMVTNLLPTEVHLLHGIGGGIGVSSLGMSPQNPGSGRYRATTECVLVRHLGEYFRRCLEKEGLYSVFTDVEMPSAITLCRMELTGFGFSQEESENQKSVMIAKLSALEEQAYTLAGHPFSLSATEDVAQVLFVELSLPPNGDPSAGPVTRSLAPNTRGGARKGRQKNPYSTSKDVLEKLKKFHPLPGVILEWRRITNALTKVVFPLQKEKVFSDRLSMYRIYSDCQLHTATGRVSLSEPNLQNVPKDFDITMPDLIGESPPPNTADPRTRRKSTKLQQMIGSRQVAMVTDDNSGQKFSVSMRHAFVPFPGGVLLAADYSQLELRMIAYLSDDKKLIQVLNEDGDVFKLITAQWKNIKPEEVTAEERAQAKQVCYGMIYGIGAKALGEQLEVEENDAAVFIESFKAKYPGMRTYLRKTVESCREKGYVQTMLGRKRYLPQITATNPHSRAQAERQAVNTTVQGSAADLVKMATIKIDEKLGEMFPMTAWTHRQKISSKHQSTLTTPPQGGFLVLQLHDELIYEVSKAHLTKVARVVREAMETAVKLPVKMPVKIKTGASWGTLTDIEL